MTSRFRAVVALLLLSGIARAGAAQVGYPPDRSPYRDVRAGGTTVLGFGYLSGSRGVAGVGPSNGNVVSFLYERSFGRMFGLHFELANARTTRYVVDPTKDATTRSTGPVNTALTMIDVGAQILLTGGKTWHGIAPFIGASVGAALSGAVAGDTSQYKFGTKLMFGPEVGVRWYLTRRLSARADANLIFWKLSYPLQYHVPPTVCTGAGCAAVIALSDPLTQWTHHTWFNFRIGWTF